MSKPQGETVDLLPSDVVRLVTAAIAGDKVAEIGFYESGTVQRMVFRDTVPALPVAKVMPGSPPPESR
jgi:hypothetical protein